MVELGSARDMKGVTRGSTRATGWSSRGYLNLQLANTSQTFN